MEGVPYGSCSSLRAVVPGRAHAARGTSISAAAPLGRHMRPSLAAAVFLLLAPAAAGCFTSSIDEDPDLADPAPTERLSAAQWKGLLTTPRFDGITSVVHRITAADGIQLSLTLHLPQGLPASEAIPTLLQITPYQSFIVPHASTPVMGPLPPGASWGDHVIRGAAYVEADARGTNGSEGCLDFGGSLDRSDAAVFIDWVRAQPWSNGIVVTDGVSHPGMGSVVAHTASADLAGALAHAPVVSYYQDEWLQGAKFEDQFNGAAYQAVEASPPIHLDPDAIKAQAAPCSGKTALDYSVVDGPFSDVWQDRALNRYTAIANTSRAPVLLTHGFVDLNVHPDHSQLYWDALPDDYPKNMILGWWYHGWPDMAGHGAERFSDIRHRWLDATLHGIDNGLDREPRVLVEDSTGIWHESRDWPLDGSERITMNATADGALVVGSGGDAGDASYMDRPGTTRGRWTDAHVAFRTEPLEGARLVTGVPVVHLNAASTATATKWVAYLLDEAPDGTWQRISHGYADSHTWQSPDTWIAIEPGTPYTWTLSLMPTAVVVKEGHRITLVVASSDSRNVENANDGAYCFDDYRGGCYNPSGIIPAESAGTAVNTVFVGGDEGTRVDLSWSDPAATAIAPKPA